MSLFVKEERKQAKAAQKVKKGEVETKIRE